MRIAVLGTGMVGRTLGTKFAELGHEVMMGSRSATNPTAQEWSSSTSGHASHDTFEAAAGFGELVVNCTSGAHSLEALRQAGPDNLAGKVIVDVANQLDFSRGPQPALLFETTDSLGELIQREFPEAKVVKALNTVTAAVMVDPVGLAGGDHTLPICGDDAEAKAQVRRLLMDELGWKDVLDLGDITAARGMEAYLMLWLRLFGASGSPVLNVKVVRPGDQERTVER